MKTTRSRRGWPALRTVLATTVALVMGGVTPAAATGGDEVVRTDAGPVRGTVHDGYRTFQGIPFAAPPVGDLRWESPQPVEPWSEVLDATTPRDRCAQNADDVTGWPGSTAEDCLYLNVTTPASASPEAPKPVLVWVHGGSLLYGAGSDYDPHRLAADGDLVVVTVNYRLGFFGFFGHPGLADDGSYGIEDQQAALRWVRENARAFGGDPGNVTLAGESAGSMSVCANLASPPAAGLFHRAVMQSAPCSNGTLATSPYRPVLDIPPAYSPEQVDELGLATAAELGCAEEATAVACLRDVPASELLAVPVLPLPGYGNQVLPEDPDDVLREGRFHEVPALSGITRDEGTLWAALFLPQPVTPEEHQGLLDHFFGDKAAEVAEAYPVSEHGTANQVWAEIMSDREWAGPAQDTDRMLAAHVPTYSYEFTDRSAPVGFVFPPTVTPGAFHGSEVPYLFDTTVGGEVTLGPEQQELADDMIAYWSSFARDGDPNAGDLPKWQRFKSGHKVPYVQGLGPGDGGIGSFDRAATHQLDFWASVG